MRYIGYFLAAFSICLVVAIFQNCSQANLAEEFSNIEIEKEQKRPDIIFILGEDAADAAPYYSLANEYFAEEFPTVQRVSHLRSLTALRDYLTDQADPASPWGNIYLLVHGNPWTGLSLPIQPEGARINSTELAALLDQNTFVPVPNAALDDESTIHLEACGLGSNPLLLHQLARALGGEDYQVPLVTASKHFISFIKNPETGGIHKYYAKPFFTFFETGKKPALLHLQKELMEQYPDTDMDWLTAMQRPLSAPGFLPKFEQFNVPVHWTSVFLDRMELPHTESFDRAATIDWIASQDDLVASVDELGVPLDKFRWQIENSSYLMDSGESLPAVEIKGKTTVLCILAPIEIVPIAEQSDIAYQSLPLEHFGFSSLDISQLE